MEIVNRDDVNQRRNTQLIPLYDEAISVNIQSVSKMPGQNTKMRFPLLKKEKIK